MSPADVPENNLGGKKHCSQLPYHLQLLYHPHENFFIVDKFLISLQDLHTFFSSVFKYLISFLTLHGDFRRKAEMKLLLFVPTINYP